MFRIRGGQGTPAAAAEGCEPVKMATLEREICLGGLCFPKEDCLLWEGT